MDLDTSIGGNHSRFPETRRSIVINIHSQDAALRECARETLIATYWKPVYKYIRVRWRQSNEDAEDLTQTFFARALEKEFFLAYDPGQARFRTYLRTCLDGFLANENKSASRIRRGGNARIVSLDFETAEGELRQYDLPSNEISPEEYFHREWVRNLFTLAVEDLRRDCDQRGKQLQYRIFERYDLNDGGEKPTYQSVAAESGISEATANGSTGRRRGPCWESRIEWTRCPTPWSATCAKRLPCRISARPNTS
jgi:RNA polymerase sigma factor (sigma-70 family)